MTERLSPLREGRVIPLRLVSQRSVQGSVQGSVQATIEATVQATVRSAEAAALFRTGTRTLRPFEVMLLSPILIPLVIVVLVLLLAWFVLWLATVGSLFTLNLIGDLSSAIRRLNGGLLRAP
jgi:ABC-type spermidine/putrescine transport system permease subunit II